MPLTVHYFTAGELAQSPPVSPLCVIGYGVARPETLAAGCPFTRVDMPALTAAAYEVWTVNSPVVYSRASQYVLAEGDGVAVMLSEVKESFSWPLEDLSQRIYGTILDHAARNNRHLLRVWNYLPNITGPDKSGHSEGMERYKRFNVGRHEAFMARQGQIVAPPAASALGSSGGATAICALMGLESGIAVENPRQVSAYNYPARYGPRSPTFSRATIATVEGGRTLLISGTASIVGHQSVHEGDVEAQAHETVINLNAVLNSAVDKGFVADPAAMKLKVYLRHPHDLHHVREVVTAAFPLLGNTLYVQADICRSELLVEVEAMCPGTV